MHGSKIDAFFQRIYGFVPRKKGASYELLVATALKLVHSDLELRANQFIEGTYSKEKYQLDSVLGALETAVEAKDYTDRNAKVGRPDVTKLAGSLQDLPLDAGIVASATGFSRPAKKYALATKINPASKPIDLYLVRPSTVEDEEDRIQSVIINLHILSLDQINSRFNPVISQSGQEKLRQKYVAGEQLQIKVDAFYRGNGRTLVTLQELTSELDRGAAEGAWTSPEPAFLKVGDDLIEFTKLEYFMAYQVLETQIIVDTRGTAELLIKAEDGTVDKLLTDIELRRVKFSAGGDEGVR
jgi:hypothetical protein